MSQPGSAVITSCGARTRAGEPCQNVAGFRTDHVGEGKCYLHGGRTPIRHGRYSGVRHVRLSDLTTEFENDPDPLDILPELAAARALFVDFIERYDVNTAALLAWHESYEATRTPLSQQKIHALGNVIDEWENEVAQLGDDATDQQKQDIATARAFIDLLRGKDANTTRPRQVLDISDAYRIVSEITKIVERIEKIRAATAISRQDFMRLMEQMGKEVMKHVTDPDTLKKIRDGWLSIAV